MFNRPADIVPGNDHANATLGRSLSDGDDIHLMIAQRAEHSPGNTVGRLEACADDGHDGDILSRPDSLDVVSLEFIGELILQTQN